MQRSCTRIVHSCTVPYLVSGRGADRVMTMQHAIDEIDPDGLRDGEHMRDSRAVPYEQRRSLAKRASRTIGWRPHFDERKEVENHALSSPSNYVSVDELRHIFTTALYAMSPPDLREESPSIVRTVPSPRRNFVMAFCFIPCLVICRQLLFE